MSYKIIRTDSYFKKLKKFIRKHPDIFSRYTKTMTLLTINPYYPSLRMHWLQGKLYKYHSISIDMQYRVEVDFIIHTD
jgi:mRNA-degrading endonuclease YafQ of YafQ-DinJ toxin-antitoxin module